MKKILFYLILSLVAFGSMAVNRTKSPAGVVLTGQGILSTPMSFSVSTDYVSQDDTFYIPVTSRQLYTQTDQCSITLDSISGSPSITLQMQGKVFIGDAWSNIGSSGTWDEEADNPLSLTYTTANTNRYFRVVLIASSTTQHSHITAFEWKTTLTAGGTTSTGVNIGTSQAIWGTTAMTIGTGAQTVAVNSSDWDISATGNMTGIGTIATDGLVTASAGVKIIDDQLLSLGTTLTNAETKITAGFDETLTGIGFFRLGDMSNPQILKVNPGATVAGSIVNINHTLGNGDCTDLLGSYSKVNVIGSGDAGITIVGDAPRAYVGLTGGSNNSVASEAYASQPWFRHQGTGAITAGSGLSAKCDVGADNFTASTINAIHAHITGASTVAGQFDGAMIEIYPDVTCLDNGLKIASDAGATVTTGLGLSGTFGNDITVSSGAKIFTGSAANGNAVYSEVGSKDATGSIYISTAGALYIQVANAGAESDWYKVTATNAD